MIPRCGRRSCPAVLCVWLLAAAAAGCGSSQSAPPATSTPFPVRVPIPFQAQPHLDHRAVAAVVRFLQAFKADNRRQLRGIMSARLRRLNRFTNLQRMLGIQSAPSRIDLIRAHTFRARRGRWTRVVARLEYDHGTAVDAFSVIRRPGGYRIWNIKELLRRVQT